MKKNFQQKICSKHYADFPCHLNKYFFIKFLDNDCCVIAEKLKNADFSGHYAGFSYYLNKYFYQDSK